MQVFAFFLLLLAGLGGLLIWSAAPEEIRGSERERLEFLKERAEQGHVFSSEEEAELCSLWQVFYGKAFTGEECSRFVKSFQENHLDSFLTAVRPCLEELKAVYGGEIDMSEFDDGLVLRFDTAATVLELRLMHKSSGGYQYKSSKNKFRVKSGEHYLNKKGVQGTKNETHFYMENCPDEQIHEIIKNHIKWRRHKGKHLSKK
jgi:hypothetical protein